MPVTEQDKLGLEGLRVWQRALELAVVICQETLPVFPPEEKYALAQQLRRSAQSIPSNIAEGHGRYYYQEGIRFCYIARGSIEETRSHISLANQLGYLEDKRCQMLTESLDDLRRMLSGYIKYLKQSKRGHQEPGSKIYDRLSEEYPDSSATE